MKILSRLKLPAFIVVALSIGWVLADAAGWRLVNEAPLPTISGLIAAGSEAGEQLRATAVRSEAAVDLLADCLMHSDNRLRQAALAISHQRLDQWQLDSPKHQQRLATQFSGSLRRLLERPTGAKTGRVLSLEAREVAARLIKTANRPTFVDGRSCLNDCQFVLSFAPAARQPVGTPDVLREGLRRSMIAPVSYDEEIGR